MPSERRFYGAPSDEALQLRTFTYGSQIIHNGNRTNYWSKYLHVFSPFGLSENAKTAAPEVFVIMS